MTAKAKPWSDARLADVGWARIEFLSDAEELRVAVPADPSLGPDTVLLARFTWPADGLAELAAAAGCARPPRAGRKTITSTPVGAPDWWTLAPEDQASGASGLWEGLGRELVAVISGRKATVFFRTYET